MEIQIIICSLLSEMRKPLLMKNVRLHPELKVFKSINGYDIKETILELKSLGIQFYSLDHDGGNYGTLANWLTKYKLIKYQVDNNIPYMCILEDDVELTGNFKEWIISKKQIIDENNIVRLMQWGEGYILSLSGATSVLEHLNRDGIRRNIDNQLREMCGKECSLYKDILEYQPSPCFLNLYYAGNSELIKTEKL